MAARTWMTDTTAIHQSLLKNICLPSSHDSGTYALQDVMSPQYGSWVQDIVNLIGEVAGALNKIPLLGKFINPFDWVYSAVIPAVKGLATATTRTIAQQLNDGIRCLDLRICYFGNDFYTYHGLLGSKVSDILNDVKKFMQSTNGEIVYITMGHWAGFTNQNLYSQFSTMVSNALGEWAYVPQLSGSTITNNPFNQTYAQIIGQGGVTKSRVILVNGQGPNTVFWPLAYSPPDNGPGENNPAAGTVISGYYTNTTNLNTMVSTQKQQQQSATLPFALYMTLTPQTSDYVGIVITSLYSALVSLAKSVALIPLIGPMLSVAVLAVAASIYIGSLAFPWRTLQQLSAKVDTQLTDLVFNNFASPGQASNIAFLYVDYYENTSVVDLAVSVSVANARTGTSQLPIAGVNEYSATSNGSTRYHFAAGGSNPAAGWTLVQSDVFRAYNRQMGSSVPIYSLYQTNSSGWNFRLSTDGTPPSGWLLNGIAFYAFVDSSDGLVPIYEFSQANSNFPTIYFYSTVPQLQGWTRTGNVFYAFSAPLIPIYAQQAVNQGQVRYNWSITNVPVPGNGWSPGAAVFEASLVQQGAAIPVYQYFTAASSSGYNYLLSKSATPPAGFQSSGLLCYAFPEYQAGLAPIREFTKSDATFGTLYQYLPAARVDGWTTGAVMFYAALPPLAGTEDVNVLDLAAVAALDPV